MLKTKASLQPSFLARFFKKVVPSMYTCYLSRTELCLKYQNYKQNFSLQSVISVQRQPCLFWENLTFISSEGKVTLCGISKSKSLQLSHISYLSRKLFIERSVLAYKNEVLKLASHLNDLLISNYYLTNKIYQVWKSNCACVKHILCMEFNKNEIPSNLLTTIEFVKNYYQDRNAVDLRNKDFVAKELQNFKHLFDTIEKQPLTLKQREAVVTDEENNLVIAGAGSGKTSIIVAKVAYLILKGLAAPEEILVFSFSKDVAKELNDRIYEKVKAYLEAINYSNTKLECLNSTASTFHGFGYKVIKDAKGFNRGELLKDNTYNEFVENLMADLLQDKEIKKLFINIFAYQIPHYINQFNFLEKEEYLRLVKSNRYRTLRGDLLKSCEEVEIANFLFIHNINYQYEQVYKYPVSAPGKKPYQPDFYLPDYDIYIEHFGINRNNKTAPFVNAEKYLQDMDWKISVHKKHKTILVETYSYERFEGNLTLLLEEKLKNYHVKFKLIEDVPKFFQVKKLLYSYERIMQTIHATLAQFFSNNLAMQHLSQRIGHRFKDTIRLHQYLDFFDYLQQKYQFELFSKSKKDFASMLSWGAKIIQEESIRYPFKYIIVDEFQDTSAGRRDLLLQIRAASDESCKTMCVGDDWQSIFRFTGSDVSVMQNFTEQFGYSAILHLDKTFRFNNKICYVASNFIQKNKNQISKSLETHLQETTPQITILYHSPSKEEEYETLLKTLDLVRQDVCLLNKKTASVYILSRYQLQDEKDKLIKKLTEQQYENLYLNFHTIHKSKGLEADYVILLRANSNGLAFPSQIDNDEIGELFLPYEDRYPYAEERRLFYVALTRAKKSVYILANEEDPSEFVLEIQKDYPNDIIAYNLPRQCNKCGNGIMKAKPSRNGERIQYFYCSRHKNDKCEHVEFLCPKCENGIIMRNRKTLNCSNSACAKEYKQCPQCRIGFLVERKNGNSVFMGCSAYPLKRCAYTASKNQC